MFTQKEYEEILQFKIDPKKLNYLPKNEREKIRKRARTFEFVDDDTAKEWPKGKVLYKIILTNNKLRKGILLLFSFPSFLIITGTKLFVPPDKVRTLIEHFHSKGSSKHVGWLRTFQMIREKHVGVSEDAVRNTLKNCDVCMKFECVRFVYLYL